MRLNFLHLDDALMRQAEFAKAGAARGARDIDLRQLGPNVRLWAREPEWQELTGLLARDLPGLESGEPVVTWMGSGDFHHVTALLVELLAKERGVPITVVAFDNHPDWVNMPSAVHCGSWVKHILDRKIADRVVGLGMTSSDFSWPEPKRAGLDAVADGRLVLFPINDAASIVWGNYGSGPNHSQNGRRLSWRGIASEPNNQDADRVLAAIVTPAIYITIDKDVLIASDARTNWDQGQMKLDQLLAWLRILIKHHTVLGVDIAGDYSRATFGGAAIDRFLKRSEIFLDQPDGLRTQFFATRDEAATNSVNAATNLAILNTLEGALC